MWGAVAFLFGFSYPWSIALSDALFTVAAVAGAYSAYRDRALMRWLWSEFRWIWIAWAFFLGYFAISSLWSVDPHVAKIRIVRKWLILLLPFFVAFLAHFHDSREKLWWGLTIGLSLHLVFCFLQWTQIVPIGPTILWGTVRLSTMSTPNDPTGMLDRLVFGFAYGLWAAILLRKWLLDYRKIWMFLLYLVSGFFVFIAQGRMGYILFIVLSLIVLTRELSKVRVSVVAGFLVAAVIAGVMIAKITNHLPAHGRIASALRAVEAVVHGRMPASEIPGRITMWKVALEMWKDHPIIGVGAGGYDKYKRIIMKRKKEYDVWIVRYYDHPHNLYVWHLATGGAIGLFSLILFLALLIMKGWKNWGEGGEYIFLAGVAVSMHAVTNITLEQHFPLLMAMLYLGMGMATMREKTLSKFI